MQRTVFTFFNHEDILYRLALIVIIGVGGGNFAWAQKSLPYTFGFETSPLNEGWTGNVPSATQWTSTGWYYSSSHSHNSSYCFRFYPTENPPQELISPELATSDKEINVSFYYKSADYSSSYTVLFNVGYSKTNTSSDSFTWLNLNKSCNSTTYALFDEKFPEGTKYIAIRYLINSTDTKYSLYIDDFEVKEYTPYKDPRNITVSSITATTAYLSWSNAEGSTPTSYQIKYKNASFTPGDADGATLVDNIENKYYTLSDLSPESTYYVYVRACYDGGNSEWVQLTGTSFTTLELYPKPTNFTLNSVAAESATFSWNNGVGTTPSAFQIKYSETQGFDPESSGTLVNSIPSSPYTVAGLTENTTYYARIRANYGSNHYSEWNSGEVTFKPTSDITINNGSNTKYNIPIRKSSINTDTKSQFVVLSNTLSAIRNRQIRRLVFYATTTTGTFDDATFDVYVKETSITSIPDAPSFDKNTGTSVVSEATLSVSEGKMIVDFSVPFNYTNGNLLISFKLHDVNLSTPSTTFGWYTLYTSKLGYYEYGNVTSGRDNYSPKITIVSRPVETAPVKIGTTGYTTFSSSWPLDLSNLPEGLSAFYATAAGVKETYVSLTPATTTVAANTGLILKGTAGQVYNIPVAESGTDLTGTNLMVGVGPLESNLSTNSNYYVLVKNSTTGKAEFQSLEENGATIPGGKAYLNATGAGARLGIVFDDETVTCIESMHDKTQGIMSNVMYNLQGQRVNQPSKGIYVKGRKKVFVK